MSIRVFVCAAVFSGMLAVPSTGMSWFDAKVFRPAIKTSGHVFWGVEVGDERCEVRVKLHYKAPKAQYDKATVYRFRAKVDFLGGGSLYTHVFTNRKPGKQVHHYAHHTYHQGCWARNTTQIKSLAVVSCEGAKCKLPKLH